jgi:spermidine synthase
MPDQKILSDKPANQPVIVNELGFLALHLDGGNFQSLMRKSQPHRLELGYTRIMMGFLLFNPLPRDIAMIGLGGGSLPKHCYRHLREASITVVEINPEVVALREHFHVPADNERFEIVCADGADYVAGQKATLDVLMVDGFDTAGQAPQLCTRKFYQDAYASLREGGVMVVNILGADSAFDSYLADIGKSFDDAVAVLPSEDCDNKIVFAVKDQSISLGERELMVRADGLEAKHRLNFRQIVAQLMNERGFC